MYYEVMCYWLANCMCFFLIAIAIEVAIGHGVSIINYTWLPSSLLTFIHCIASYIARYTRKFQGKKVLCSHRLILYMKPFVVALTSHFQRL